MRYKLVYLDETGKRVEKYIKSKKERVEILEDLRKENKTIINLEESRDYEFSFYKKNRKISKKKTSVFLRKFSILLSSGMEVKPALEILKSQEEDQYFNHKLGELIDYLDLGFTLSESIERTQAFPEILGPIIESGEKASVLSEVLELLNEFYENEIKLKDSIKNSLYYPFILLGVTAMVIIFVVSFVLPNYISLFNSFGIEELPKMTRNLIRFSNFVSDYYISIIIVSLILILLLREVFKQEKVRIGLSRFLLRLPIFGKYLKNLDIQRFSAIMYLLSKSGLSIIESIIISSETLSNSYMKQSLTSVEDSLLKGNTIYKSFESIGIFPPIFLNLVQIGEESSKLEEVLDLSYNYFKDSNEIFNKKITALFEPLIILIVSFVVGSIVIAIALPSFSIINVI